MLGELADSIMRQFTIIFKRSWHGKVPEDWKKSNITLVLKKRKEEDSGNY